MESPTALAVATAVIVVTQAVQQLLNWLMDRQNKWLARSTHALVNSGMGNQLRLTAVLARRLAEKVGDPADLAAADLAERQLLEYEVRQAAADHLEPPAGGRPFP